MSDSDFFRFFQTSNFQRRVGSEMQSRIVHMHGRFEEKGGKRIPESTWE